MFEAIKKNNKGLLSFDSTSVMRLSTQQNNDHHKSEDS